MLTKPACHEVMNHQGQHYCVSGLIGSAGALLQISVACSELTTACFNQLERLRFSQEAPYLHESALATLKVWRFSPALRNGLPVTAVAEIEVPFTLNDFLTHEELKRRLEELEHIRQNFEKVITAIEDANRKR